jgi:RNA polymerase sigma factor (sigma-70 family)
MSTRFWGAGAEVPEERGEHLVRLYLTDIGRHPLLTKRDEVRLAQAMEAGNAAQARMRRVGRELAPARRRELHLQVQAGEKAKRAFVASHLRLVVSVAKAYQASGAPLLDLIQEGNLGLIHAVGEFDWRRGLRFSTDATWWISQAITRGIAKRDRTLQLPTEVRRTVLRARNEHSLELELGRSAPLAGPEDAVVDRARRDEVARLLDSLSLRERDILRLRFGFGDDRRRTISQVAVVVGLTPQKVSQIQAKALQKLRRQHDHSQGSLSALCS